MSDKFIIASKNIFSEGSFFEGYFSVEDGKIKDVIRGKIPDHLYSKNLKDFGENIVMPALIDCHAFFTGYYVRKYGIDISLCRSCDQIIEAIKGSAIDKVIIARGLKNKEIINHDLIEKNFSPDTSILLLNWEEEFAFVNESAAKRFDFDGTNFSSEGMWKILHFVLTQKEDVKNCLGEYQKLLHSKGVSTSKEMVFDDSYGLAEILKFLDDENKLNLRIFMMSQPVAYPMSLETGKKLKEIANSDFLKFDGFNQMVDGSISVKEADLKIPYEDGDICQIGIDYQSLKKDALLADENDFRFSLHGQGDKAIHNIISIFDKCRKNEDGKLINRHAITDLEFTDPKDLEKMAELGIFAEIYPQIMSIYDDPEAKIELTYNRVGQRAINYWNRRKMQDLGIKISCATDLPLVIQDLGQSILGACYHRFNDMTPFQTQNSLKLEELLSAWTINGAKNLNIAHIQGAIKNNYRADFIVLNKSPQEINEKTALDLNVTNTFIAGICVFDSKHQ